MKRFFQKHFLPHKSNQYRPHFFRAPVVALMLLMLGGSFFLFSIALKKLPSNGSYAAVYSGAVISYTNQDREAAGDADLAPNALLTEAAQMKADDMAANGYFAHTSPDGKTSWYWFNKVGYEYAYAGENLAINFSDSIDVTNAWMASPAHRENLLRPVFTQIGVATAVGMYQGKETTFVVQMFGTPAVAAAPIVVEKSVAKVPAAVSAQASATTVSALPAKEDVAGAYSVDSISIAGKAAASPRKVMSTLYLIFILFVLVLLVVGSALEFKRHHKSIWLAGGILILAAGIFWALCAHFGQGAIAF